jgi:hypothetical protein
MLLYIYAPDVYFWIARCIVTVSLKECEIKLLWYILQKFINFLEE